MVLREAEVHQRAGFGLLQDEFSFCIRSSGWMIVLEALQANSLYNSKKATRSIKAGIACVYSIVSSGIAFALTEGGQIVSRYG